MYSFSGVNNKLPLYGHEPREDKSGDHRQEEKFLSEQAGLSADELHVQEMPINPLKYNSVAKPEGKRAIWKAHLSHLLDGLSALFSLACGSATLACMGVLEWR